MLKVLSSRATFLPLTRPSSVVCCRVLLSSSVDKAMDKHGRDDEDGDPGSSKRAKTAGMSLTSPVASGWSY